jgi:hypothetical protein
VLLEKLLLLGSGEELRVARRARRGGLWSWVWLLLVLELAIDVRVSVLWRWLLRI